MKNNDYGGQLNIWEAVQTAATANETRQICHARVGELQKRSYGELVEDGRRAAAFISESSSDSSPVCICLGGYLAAALVLACSYLGRDITVCAEKAAGISFNGEDGRVFISADRLLPIISGTDPLRAPARNVPDHHGILITFRSATGFERSYSEASALLAAFAFADVTGLSRMDRFMTCLPCDDPRGLFCGLLAPIAVGSHLFFCDREEELMSCLGLCSPTKLFCSELLSSALLLRLEKIRKKTARNDKLSLRGVNFLTPERLLLRRLVNPRITLALGGRLRTLITSGGLSDRQTISLFSMGVFSIMIMSLDGLSPALFRTACDKKGVWHLPKGCISDLFGVGKGGMGRLALSSPFQREGKAVPFSLIAGEKRSEPQASDEFIMTDLFGFVLRDGSVFTVDKPQS